MRIVFHGANAASFAPGFAALLDPGAEVETLSDALDAPGERDAYAAAEAVIGVRFDTDLPSPGRLRLFQVPGAGTDAVRFDALPPQAAVCNCFGHEAAIAEYVMAALLQWQIPMAEADRRLRRGEWAYWAGDPARAHGELAGRTLGLLGFGHIARAVARRARAFDMRVHVANRSPLPAGAEVDRAQGLDDLPGFCRDVEALVVTVPLSSETRGLVGEAALAALPHGALVVNVARGPVIDEQALYDALAAGRVQAAIDTWYRYPSAPEPAPLPAALPFHTLPNLVMTPHMSGWTDGTIRRRQRAMADNVNRLRRGEPLVNRLR
ncbi:2-hydroxyacid dehydrogenase [Roseomonas sp. OT10]|uniref:2-hydroxyacid dehydrogenase n=1 Tax=Roseomonas cutis TaxID=2897332 RepID=UPI001E35426D|nr:2-hydroxyacid dehydrogenase [Roseomonas sp. OT10]UFN47874.1 2-hydroxyacid dehydrogenase [Roseomonas sp. OT10]